MVFVRLFSHVGLGSLCVGEMSPLSRSGEVNQRSRGLSRKGKPAAGELIRYSSTVCIELTRTVVLRWIFLQSYRRMAVKEEGAVRLL